MVFVELLEAPVCVSCQVSVFTNNKKYLSLSAAIACWVILHALLACRSLFLSQSKKKNIYKKKTNALTSRVSNSLDPDQDRHFVGPDLDPSCIQRLSGKCPTTEAGEELNIARELLYTDRLIVDNYCKINITNTTLLL